VNPFFCGIRWRHRRTPNSEPCFWSILQHWCLFIYWVWQFKEL